MFIIMSNLGLSIIIVGKNCEDTIKDCLISIYKQSFKPKKFEIIYLDGGSTDSTLEIISDYKDIKIILIITLIIRKPDGI